MNYMGVFLSDAQNVLVANNTVTYGLYGVALQGSRYVTVGNNTVSSTANGIFFDNVQNSTAVNNLVTSSQVGMLLQDGTTSSEVSYNQILHSSNAGISLSTGAASNSVHDNIIANTAAGGESSILTAQLSTMEGSVQGVGVKIDSSNGNIFYHNSFTNNQVQASVTGTTNAWDNGYPSGGNYWDTYTGSDLYRWTRPKHSWIRRAR